MSDVMPPPPPQGGTSCWKVGGITCGAGCLVLLAATIVFMVFLAPRIKKAVSASVTASQQLVGCQQQLVHVGQAISEYHRDKGKYPVQLTDLVPAYLPSKASLYWSQDPQKVPFTYFRPKETDPGTVTMLEYRFTMVIGEMTQTMPLRVRKDGTVENPNNMGAFGNSKRNP